MANIAETGINIDTLRRIADVWAKNNNMTLNEAARAAEQGVQPVQPVESAAPLPQTGD